MFRERGAESIDEKVARLIDKCSELRTATCTRK